MRNWVMCDESPHKDKNLRMWSYVLSEGHPSIAGHSSEFLQAYKLTSPCPMSAFLRKALLLCFALFLIFF